jgi:hypothetical protein
MLKYILFSSEFTLIISTGVYGREGERLITSAVFDINHYFFPMESCSCLDRGTETGATVLDEWQDNLTVSCGRILLHVFQ